MFVQLRESIGQDQEKTEILKVQSQELESKLQNLDAKIHHTEVTLKDMRKLQDQITIKTAERSTLFREQQRQYAALAEENEGLPCMGTAILFFCISHIHIHIYVKS